MPLYRALRFCLTSRCRIASASVLLLVLAPGRTVAAQTRAGTIEWGASAGVAFQTASLDGHLSKTGPIGSLFLRWSAAPRLALTVEALAAHFGVSVDHIHGPCPPEAGPFECHTPVGEVNVGAVTAGMRWADSAVAMGKGGSYLLLGGGMYRALSHPTAPGATRLGWTAGFGFVLVSTRPRLALEVRYHQMPRWPEDRISLFPITLALSW